MLSIIKMDQRLLVSIREIPSKEFREIADALDEFTEKLKNKGVLLDETV